MTAFENPALTAFVAEINPELIFAQTLIRRVSAGFELRHSQDRESASENLRLIREDAIRALVQSTASGAFRPLKSAPNMQAGWRFVASDKTHLEFALHQIYPGAIADWFAAKFAKAAPTNYREFTNRQTGMYRITGMLTDAQAAPMIRACCHKNFCLKQRLWTVGGLAADASEEKSLIPCLEPCAVLLEFARKAMRLEQAAERGETPQEPSDNSVADIREADFENPNNPRRMQLAIESKKASTRDQ